MYESLKWLEQCLEYELKTKINGEKLFCSWLFAYAKSWAAINWEKLLFLHLCAPIFSSARLPRDNCFNWWMGSKWLLFSFLTLASLFPLLSIDLIYWPGLTRHQNLWCYQKTIFLVDVLKVTRYDWQKSHFSPVEGVQSQWGRNREGAVVRSLFLQ